MESSHVDRTHSRVNAATIRINSFLRNKLIKGIKRIRTIREIMEIREIREKDAHHGRERSLMEGARVDCDYS